MPSLNKQGIFVREEKEKRKKKEKENNCCKDPQHIEKPPELRHCACPAYPVFNILSTIKGISAPVSTKSAAKMIQVSCI